MLQGYLETRLHFPKKYTQRVDIILLSIRDDGTPQEHARNQGRYEDFQELGILGLPEDQGL